MTTRNLLEASEELLISPHLHGIKLLIPSNSLKESNPNSVKPHTVRDALKLPLCVYFMDRNSAIQTLNEPCVDACNYPSKNGARGKSLRDVFEPFSASLIINNDKEVIQKNRRIIIEEVAEPINKTRQTGLTIKVPWYDTKDKIIGVFGATLLYGVHSIPDSLEHILNLGLLNQNEISNSNHYLSNEMNAGLNIDPMLLSIREKQCLHYLQQGKTAKETGNILQLSHRTIEKHFENLKTKFHCKKKRDLLMLYNITHI